MLAFRNTGAFRRKKKPSRIWSATKASWGPLSVRNMGSRLSSSARSTDPEIRCSWPRRRPSSSIFEPPGCAAQEAQRALDHAQEEQSGPAFRAHRLQPRPEGGQTQLAHAIHGQAAHRLARLLGELREKVVVEEGGRAIERARAGQPGPVRHLVDDGEDRIAQPRPHEVPQQLAAAGADLGAGAAQAAVDLLEIFAAVLQAEEAEEALEGMRLLVPQ